MRRLYFISGHGSPAITRAKTPIRRCISLRIQSWLTGSNKRGKKKYMFFLQASNQVSFRFSINALLPAIPGASDSIFTDGRTTGRVAHLPGEIRTQALDSGRNVPADQNQLFWLHPRGFSEAEYHLHEGSECYFFFPARVSGVLRCLS